MIDPSFWALVVLFVNKTNHYFHVPTNKNRFFSLFNVSLQIRHNALMLKGTPTRRFCCIFPKTAQTFDQKPALQGEIALVRALRLKYEIISRRNINL